MEQQGLGVAVQRLTLILKNLSSTSGGAVTLTAQWVINTSTLVVNPNNGIYGGTTNNTTYSNKSYNTTQTIVAPTREGYTFTGWTLLKTGGGTANGSITSNTPTATATQTYTFGPTSGASDTLTATWEINGYDLTASFY